MPKPLDRKLREKGWRNDEINKALSIIAKADRKKKGMNIIIYWAALLLAIIGNLVISLALVPILIALQGLVLYLMIVVLALSFGFLFDILIRDIEKLSAKHYIIAGVFIPAIALVNIFYMAILANEWIVAFKLNTEQHNPFVVMIAYVCAFMLPYVTNKVVMKK